MSEPSMRAELAELRSTILKWRYQIKTFVETRTLRRSEDDAQKMELVSIHPAPIDDQMNEFMEEHGLEPCMPPVDVQRPTGSKDGQLVGVVTRRVATFMPREHAVMRQAAINILSQAGALTEYAGSGPFGSAKCDPGGVKDELPPEMLPPETWDA